MAGRRHDRHFRTDRGVRRTGAARTTPGWCPRLAPTAADVPRLSGPVLRGFGAILSRTPKGTDVSELRAVADQHNRSLGRLKQALSALRGNGKIPAAPKVNTVTIDESSKPKFSGTFYTKDLIGPANSALADTAWNARINDRVARTAVDNGQPELGRLMSGLQRQEEQQNWPSLSNMAGYVGSKSANLKESIAGEKGAIDMYGRFAGAAAGDATVASTFEEFGADEQGHLKVFSRELDQLKH